MNRTKLILAGLALLLGGVGQARADFIAVDFSANANASLQALDSSYPAGNVTLGGIPFAIPSSGNNIWRGDVPSDPGIRTLTIPVGVYGVENVYSLINSFGGQPGPSSYASVEFIGSGGADYIYDLVGNSDIRDWNNDGFTNSINDTTTINVVSLEGGQHRLDMQTYSLPAAFQSQTLTDIVLTDSGDDNFQRVFLAGLTVASTPEPSTLTLLGIGAAGLVGYGWRRRRRSD